MEKAVPSPDTIVVGGPPPPYIVPPPSTQTSSNYTYPQTPPPVGPKSQLMVCPFCHCQIKSKVVSKATTKTHLIALCCCLCLCWLCCCLPYCMDSCRNQNHYCPNCSAFLGVYEN